MKYEQIREAFEMMFYTELLWGNIRDQLKHPHVISNMSREGPAFWVGCFNWDKNREAFKRVSEKWSDYLDYHGINRYDKLTNEKDKTADKKISK